MRMGVHLSIKAKLVMASSAAQELKSTMEEFNRACNTLSELAFQRDLHRKYDIHHHGYRLIRQETNLPAQHVINAIAKVSAVYTRAQNKWHQFKSHSSVRYDAKSMTLSQDCQTASLTVCPKGRVTGRLQMSARMLKQLCQGKPGSAELVYRKGNFYLHISITIPAPGVKQPQGSLGADLGFNRVAVTSDNKFHTAKNIRHKNPATKGRDDLSRPTAVRAPNGRSSVSLVVRGVLSRTPITASVNKSLLTRKRTINGSSWKTSTGFVRRARRNAFTNGVLPNFNG
jgi:putative transposase